jgi:hypothetical protein
MPARINRSRASRDREAGPMVQTILVLGILVIGYWLFVIGYW